MEGLPSGTVLGAVSAKDPDEGENGTMYYSLSGECDKSSSSYMYKIDLFPYLQP